MNLFYLFSYIIIFSALIALTLSYFKIPLLISYILTGILISNLSTIFTKEISILGELGLIFLLFLVGLRLDLKRFSEFSKEIIYLGIGQIFFTTILGTILGILLGINLIHAFMIGIAFSFSSTIIVTKILLDKNDLDTLYGRLSLGMLLIQDLFAILILLIIGVFSINKITILEISDLISIIFIFTGLYFLGKLISKFFLKIKNNSELIFLLSLAWLMIFIIIAKYKNFSIEAAAILAGISLSGSNVLTEITRKFSPIKDLFLIFFFVYLGSQINLNYATVFSSLVYTLFILIFNPLIVFYILNFLNYPRRVAFEVGLTTAQISEFSFILIQTFSKQYTALTGFVGILTFLFSSFMLYNNSKIYNLIKNLLEKIEIKKIETEEAEIKNHIIIIGFHRIGYILAHKILEKTKNIIVVDFDPAIEKALKKENIPHILGDIMDDEVLAKLNIEKAKLIISTIPHNEENLFILEKLKDKNIPIIVTATNVFDAMNYYKLGAFYVIIPHFLGGEKAGELILSILDNLENNKVTEEHKKYLQSKIELEHL